MPDSDVSVGALNRTVPPAEEPGWRRGIQQQLESAIEKRVREALSTPPTERLQRRRRVTHDRAGPAVGRDGLHTDLNSHLLDQAAKDRLKYRRFMALKHSAPDSATVSSMAYYLRPPPSSSNAELPVSPLVFRDRLSKYNQDEFPGVFELENLSEGIKEIREDFANTVSRLGFAKLHKGRHAIHTKEGFLRAVRGRAGTAPVGGLLQALEGGTGQYADRYGVVRDGDGPFWPVDCLPLFPAPRFLMGRSVDVEPLSSHLSESDRTADNQITPYHGLWRGTLIVYDSERTPRDFVPQAVTEDLCPSLAFESRFESGNLRQARRVGMYDYELVLQTDLYTRRHTQWFLFRVQNALPGVTYRLTIINLLKPDSLYNYGMRPLVYSQRGAEGKQRGWRRCGHHISYAKNLNRLSCPLLARSLHHYQLQWQMEFPYAEDTCYLAHCYPYTFTDLKVDIARLASRADSKGHVRREVLCESRAGNSCFLLTITNFERRGPKKAVVVTGRVHPGESQASWMMRGLLDFLTGPHPAAQELRDRFVFKVVPMLNPDGVIVGNYRCSLAARDLNRNYRHPRPDAFPTIHAVKAMMEDLAADYEILLYCDLHGHSRRHNVFMYGNNTSTAATTTTTPGGGGGEKGAEEGASEGAIRAFLSERLFPWLMASTCRDKFSFPSCKFHIQRCKESTGRVVMWRQLQVFNSFTLEASFSGSILNSNQRRHFNVHDLMDVGRSLAMTVLEYDRLQQDSLKQTQTIVEMTQAFTQQILQRRGVKAASSNNTNNSSTLVNSTARANSTARNTSNTTATATHHSSSGPERQKSHMETQLQLVRADTEKWTAAVLNLLQNKPDLDFPVDLEKDQGQSKTGVGQANLKERTGRMSSFQSSTRADGSEAEVTKGQGQGLSSVSAIDHCLSVLAALNVREMLEESDSSDSDSESEPEMKSGKEERKPRKKKRKSRKRRNRDRQAKKQNASNRRHEGDGKKIRYRGCSPAAPTAVVPRTTGKPVPVPAVSATLRPPPPTPSTTKAVPWEPGDQRALSGAGQHVLTSPLSSRAPPPYLHPLPTTATTLLPLRVVYVGKDCPLPHPAAAAALSHPGVSVTSRFVKMAKGGKGKCLYVPARLVRKRGEEPALVKGGGSEEWEEDPHPHPGTFRACGRCFRPGGDSCLSPVGQSSKQLTMEEDARGVSGTGSEAVTTSVIQVAEHSLGELEDLKN